MRPPIPKELRTRLNGNMMRTPDGRHGIVVHVTQKYIFLMFEKGVFEKFAKYELYASYATFTITPPQK